MERRSPAYSGWLAFTLILLCYINPVQAADTLVVSAVVTDVSCRGLSDGEIDITVSGGQAPYTFNWLDIDGTDDPEDRTGLSTGLYNLTVTDANDSILEEAIRVGQPYNLTLSATNPFGALNITESVNDPNPFPSNEFSWGWSHSFPASGGATFEYNATYDNEYIPEGYTLDTNWLGNCLLSYTQNDDRATSNAFHTGASRVTEFHDFNPGDLTNASGDIYHIHGRGHFGFNSSPDGPHDWTVTYDFSGLANGYLPAGTLIAFIDIDGENGLNENLLLTATGTADPWLEVFDYTAEIPTHGTAEYNAEGKPANSYYFDGPPVGNAAIAYLTSRDVISITIHAKSAAGGGGIGMKLAAPLIPFVEEDVSCSGGSDGITTVAVAGGTGPYEYVWSNGATTKSITGLSAGVYSVTVTDTNSCAENLSQTIAEPALPLSATITDQTNILCYGDTAGSVTIEADPGSGTAPYEYSLDGSSFGSSGNFNNLAGGDYTVVVKDTNECIHNLPVTISQPDELSGIVSGSTQICTGDSALVTIQLAGGTQPWKVTWPGDSNLNLNGSEPYDFSFSTGPLTATAFYDSINISLSDVNGCNGTIGGNAEISVGPVISCPPHRTEYLDENCEFILPDYSSLISVLDNCDPAPVINQTSLPGEVLSGSGTIHEVLFMVQDISGNEAACGFEITLLDTLQPVATALSDTTVIVTDGTYEANISLPSPGFYDNCGILSVVNDYTGTSDASGTYPHGTTDVLYTVTDINSNTAQFVQQVTVEIENEPDHGLIIPEAFSPNEDGYNDRFRILGLEAYSENHLQIFNVNGMEVFSMTDYDHSWDGNQLPTGTYYYVLSLNSATTVIKGFVYLRRE